MIGLVAGRPAERIFSSRRGTRRPREGVSPWLLATLVAVIAVRKAAAERAIVVDEPGNAPFAATELAAAIRVRIASDGAPVRVRVTPTTTGVRIETRGERREVDLAGLHGEDAARMVALAADDLLVDDLAPPPRAYDHAAQPLELGVLGAVTGWDGVLGGVTLDFAVPRDGYAWTLEVGGAEPLDSALAMTAAVVRVGPALRARGFELRAGVTLAPLFVSSGVGDQTVLVGANASARTRVELGTDLWAILAVGVDAYATHTRYQLDAMTIATPWVAPWFAAGLEVGL
jgi:hypothetical protein